MGGGIGSILYSDRPAGDNPGREYFVYNAVGHTVAIVTEAGAVKSSNLYEAFGNIVISSGTSENNRLANTKERDKSIGLDNHGFRYFDPEIGRYTTRDPAGYGDGLNVYLHVHNNPINHVDPLGLLECDDREIQGKTRKLKDVAKTLEQHVNQTIETYRKRGLEGQALADAVFKALGENVPGSGVDSPVGSVSQLVAIEDWLQRNLTEKQQYQFSFEESQYGANPTGVLAGIITPWLFSLEIAQHGLAPTVRVEGALMGTDKWGHFFQQGYWFHRAEQTKVLTVKETVLFGQYLEGDLSWRNGMSLDERIASESKFIDAGKVVGEAVTEGMFGRYATRVISRADMSANAEGANFYRRLVTEKDYVFRARDFATGTFNESVNNPNKPMPKGQGLKIDTSRGVPKD